MAAAWKTARVYISSTFRDMHAERDHLVKVTFPRLRQWCEERRLRLVDIDLRGVSRRSRPISARPSRFVSRKLIAADRSLSVFPVTAMAGCRTGFRLKSAIFSMACRSRPGCPSLTLKSSRNRYASSTQGRRRRTGLSACLFLWMYDASTVKTMA